MEKNIEKTIRKTKAQRCDRVSERGKAQKMILEKRSEMNKKRAWNKNSSTVFWLIM